jgi:hypothetical protein
MRVDTTIGAREAFREQILRENWRSSRLDRLLLGHTDVRISPFGSHVLSRILLRFQDRRKKLRKPAIFVHMIHGQKAILGADRIGAFLSNNHCQV